MKHNPTRSTPPQHPSQYVSPHGTIVSIDWLTDPPTVTACSPVSEPDPEPVQVPGLTPDGMRDWLHGELIQRAMPNVSPDHRELLMTGITPVTWRRMFPKDE